MKILILSCTTGEGHNSCAKALKLYFDSHNIESVIMDTIGMANKSVAGNVSDIYVYTTKNSLFKIIYNIGDGVSHFLSRFGTNCKSPVYLLNMMYMSKLEKFINNSDFDAVICTHLFPSEALTALKRRGRFDLPCIYVMTDYVCIPFVYETEMDKYIIPHKDLVCEFSHKHVPEEKLVPLGIPVDHTRFSRDAVDKLAARQHFIDEYHLPEKSINGRWFLIMSGSMGFGDLDKLIEQLLARCKHNDRVFCVCGYNKNVKKSLKEKFDDKRLRTIGFTLEIPTFMDACDVLFTKPGGLSSTEAVIKNIPLIHTTPIPGLEGYNANFFHSHNMSYFTNDVKEQVDIAMKLCNDADFRNQMLQAQRANSNPNVCADIAALMQRLVDEHKQKKQNDNEQ